MSFESKQFTKLIRNIDIEIDKLNIDTSNCDNLVFISDHMLKMQKIILVSIIGFGALIGGISNIGNFLMGMLYGGLYGFGYSVIPVLVSLIFYSGVKRIFNKKIKENKEEIDIYRELRNFYEEELAKVKEEIKTDNDCENDYVLDMENAMYNSKLDKGRVKKLTLKKYN